MCDCRFCNTPAQNILECIRCPLSLIGHSTADGEMKNILLFDKPSHGTVFANGEKYDNLTQACSRLSVSLDSLRMKDITLGILRFDLLKDAKWRVKEPLQSEMEQTLRNCQAKHEAENTSLVLTLLPEMGKRIRTVDNNQSNTRQRILERFDPASTPSHAWTSEKLLEYMRECPTSNQDGFPKMMEIVDEYRRLYKTTLCCRFAHKDGSTVDLWMPQGIVYFASQYYKIWQNFEKQKENIDTSWDVWSA